MKFLSFLFTILPGLLVIGLVLRLRFKRGAQPFMKSSKTSKATINQLLEQFYGEQADSTRGSIDADEFDEPTTEDGQSILDSREFDATDLQVEHSLAEIQLESPQLGEEDDQFNMDWLLQQEDVALQVELVERPKRRKVPRRSRLLNAQNLKQAVILNEILTRPHK